MKRLARGCALALALLLLFPSLAAVCAADTEAADSSGPTSALSEPFDSGADGAPSQTTSQNASAPTIGGSEPAAQSAQPVLDSGQPPAIGCSTAEELLRQLRNEQGGTIELTGDIEWDHFDRVIVEKATTVRMGDYGIHIADGGVLSLEGPVCFEGRDSEKPLFTVEGQFFSCKFPVKVL